MRFATAVLMAFAACRANAATPEIPIEPGLTFVLAVDNSTKQTPAEGIHILQGDYEVVIAITAVGDEGIVETASLDGYDERNVHQQALVPRRVLPADLANAYLQVWGFHTDDPPVLSGATSLGPSLGLTRELAKSGRTAYSARNFLQQPVVSGTLTRSNPPYVDFPVLLNGERVTLLALHATGQMALGEASRPFETMILDHPRYPISLRIAYGPRGGGFPFQPDFRRDVVRIDFPVEDVSLAESLDKDCRVEVSGIYFDFNQATLKPQSKRALEEIAAAVTGPPARRVRIEGHTDSVGSDAYNDDLSKRRADAVRSALVRDYAVDGARLTTAGRGERAPKESNDTLAGRASNRRVELACAGS